MKLFLYKIFNIITFYFVCYKYIRRHRNNKGKRSFQGRKLINQIFNIKNTYFCIYYIKYMNNLFFYAYALCSYARL